MINFTVGPVVSQPEVLAVAGVSAPYFRTAEFSKIMLENEALMLEFLKAPDESRCVFLTTSGTGAMEACVLNVLTQEDKVICVNGGVFGQRFVDLCKLYKIDYAEIICDFGAPLSKLALEKYKNMGYTALLVNMHETSSGILYDMKMISDFCKQNRILLIIDAISAFIADEIDMGELEADVIITGSQKALAVQPGISIITLSPKALNRIWYKEENCLYLSLKQALKNMERGQTPFTPAVTTLVQIHVRLNYIKERGGIAVAREKIKDLTVYFRSNLKNLPLEFLIKDEINRSNGVTAVRSLNHKAGDIFNILKDEFKIWVCPNGGIYKNDIFRVGHLGDLSIEDYEKLFSALKKMKERGYI